MNKFRKVICVILVATLVCMNQVYVNAETTEESSIIERIANGSYEVIGSGVGFDEVIKPRQEASTYFTSGGVNHTHQYIVAKAITMLKRDKGITFFDGSRGTTVMEYADKPDVDDTGWLFAAHFWNPDTDKNFLGSKKNTAKTRFNDNYNLAVQNYKTNPTLSYQYLGRALHYISDAGVPHHSANKLAVITNHSKYEKWVDQNRTSFSATTSNKYSICTSSSLTNIIKKVATLSKSYSKTVDNKDNWTLVANATVPETQRYVAGVLYRYLCDVGEI